MGNIKLYRWKVKQDILKLNTLSLSLNTNKRIELIERKENLLTDNVMILSKSIAGAM